jgi:hypothetical protein
VSAVLGFTRVAGNFLATNVLQRSCGSEGGVRLPPSGCGTPKTRRRTMAYFHGNFVWRELMTTNVEASKGFYGELFN